MKSPITCAGNICALTTIRLILLYAPTSQHRAISTCCCTVYKRNIYKMFCFVLFTLRWPIYNMLCYGTPDKTRPDGLLTTTKKTCVGLIITITFSLSENFKYLFTLVIYLWNLAKVKFSCSIIYPKLSKTFHDFFFQRAIFTAWVTFSIEFGWPDKNDSKSLICNINFTAHVSLNRIYITALHLSLRTGVQKDMKAKKY